MTVEAKKKVATLGWLLLTALCSGALTFAVAKIESAGEYKNKVDELELWKKEHSTEFSQMKIDQKTTLFELRALDKKFDKLDKKFDERWYHTR